MRLAERQIGRLVEVQGGVVAIGSICAGDPSLRLKNGCGQDDAPGIEADGRNDY